MSKMKYRRLIFRAGFWVCLLDLTLLRQPWTFSGIISFLGVLMIVDPLLCWCMEVFDD